MNTRNDGTNHGTDMPLEFNRYYPLVILLSRLMLALVLGIMFMAISY